jgi:hypothetical protein
MILFFLFVTDHLIDFIFFRKSGLPQPYECPAKCPVLWTGMNAELGQEGMPPLIALPGCHTLQAG